MKKFYITILTFAMIALKTMAATGPDIPENPPASISFTNNQTIQSTLNDVVIDILRGAKTASGEVYQASKTAVVASADFAKKQVPDVVEQFLRWQITERVVYIIGWSVFVGFLIYISRSCNDYCVNFRKNNAEDFSKKYYFTPLHYDNANLLKWLTRLGVIIIVIVNIWWNGMTIAKIAIAPKVYLIEYVVDTIQSTQHQSRR